jgi:hypothetical protein
MEAGAWAEYSAGEGEERRKWPEFFDAMEDIKVLDAHNKISPKKLGHWLEKAGKFNCRWDAVCENVQHRSEKLGVGAAKRRENRVMLRGLRGSGTCLPQRGGRNN